MDEPVISAFVHRFEVLHKQLKQEAAQAVQAVEEEVTELKEETTSAIEEVVAIVEKSPVVEKIVTTSKRLKKKKN